MSNLLKMLTLLTFIHLCVFCSNDANEIPTPNPSPTTQVSDSLLLSTPEAARNYIRAVNQNSLDALVDAFDVNGTVVDVTRNITGHTAIRTWARNEVMGGSLRVIEINRQTANSVRLLVHWAPRGSQGWRAWYTFTYANGKITIADLQYA